MSELVRWDLPINWALTSLGDLTIKPMTDIVDGPFGSNLKTSEYVDSGVPIVRLQNVAPGEFIEKNIRCITPDKAASLKRHSYEPGDLIITKLGDPLGEACIVPDHFPPGVIVADIVRARLAPSINRHGIMYAINSEQVQSQLKAWTKGTTRPRVNLQHVRSVKIPIPPIGELDRIVAEIEKQPTRLDAATAALKLAQANLKHYRASVLKAACEGRLAPTEAELARREGRDYEPADQLLQRILRERRARWEADTLARMIASGDPPEDDRWKQKYKEPGAPDTANRPRLPAGWCWASFEQVSEIQGGIQKQPSRRPAKNAFPFLRVANVLRGRLDILEMHNIELFPGELQKFRLEPGDLLIVEGNGSPSEIGRMAIWRGEIRDCVHQNHIIRARPVSGADPDFLASFWNSPTGTSQVTAVASSTTGLHTLSVGKISGLCIPLPPAAEQSRIIAAVERILTSLDRTEQTVLGQIQRAGAVRRTVLSGAFAGNLVPQDPADEPASVLLERIRSQRAATPKSPVRRKREELVHA